ncbi:hypothetical protein [Hymenobacter sp. B81]|uniref:hypothetical protein n=1 Tax=Hymenobacter sp. B81 TaxID=3344878 RepID=UPI0037DDDE92
MAYFTKADLRLQYNWKAKQEGDNPQITGFPDRVLLDRTEGYEVLAFINRFAESRAWRPDNGAAGHKLERMIREHPGHIRSHKNVEDWVMANWSRF